MAISSEVNNGAGTGTDDMRAGLVSGTSSGSGVARQRGTKRGMAFLVEALVILAFLMLALAVFAQLFAGAQVEGIRATRLSEAVVLATNRAEEFSANPTSSSVTASSEQGDLTVNCVVEPDKHVAGTLYEATITVTAQGDEIYTLTTSRYVSDAQGGDTT